ncbi:hypothetical protein ACFOOP_01340 [Marinicaulis aureus]|uniref:DUF4386 domain-containing protein n=1 Tax=Hyphococcus aureus TaxID=2666033 RepID=A0ABW1KUI8_9PROT
MKPMPFPRITGEGLCAWMGPAFILILIPAWLNMGFLPPPSPQSSADEIAAFFRKNADEIKLGAMMTMQFCMLGLFWTAAIFVQLKRTKSQLAQTLSYLQFIAGAVAYSVFTLPTILWTTIVFRSERPASEILLLNDFAWLALVMPVSSAMIQAAAIGVAILVDAEKSPIFPRWSGYMNLWVSLTFGPGMLATFFNHGPFAWDGVFVFYVPLAVFTAWVFVMSYLVSAAASQKSDQREDSVHSPAG